MKSIVFTSMSTPCEPPVGYGDVVNVVGEDGALLYSSKGSTCPNGFRPSDKASWYTAYGWIAKGEYKGGVVQHPRFGKCVLVEGGGEVGARCPNPNHEGKFILTEVFIHVGNPGGKNPNWRGSAGCLTIHKDDWVRFVSVLNDDERVIVKVV